MGDREPGRYLHASVRTDSPEDMGSVDAKAREAAVARGDIPASIPATAPLRATAPVPATASWNGADGHELETIAELRTQLTKAQDELNRREQELAALRIDLQMAQTLAAKLRRSVSRSARAIDQRRFAISVSRAVLMRMAALASLPWRRGLFGRRAQQAELIRASLLFDAKWYLQRNSDVAASGFDPLRHYIDFGASEGRDPHPLFDSDWYLSNYPEVALARVNPLAHYVSIGASHGFDPNPLFHTAWYLEQNPDVAEARVNPLTHYLTHATEDGRNPNPFFDSAWYHQKQGLAETGENPLVHYLLHGAAEGCDPHPAFDTAWYLSRYPRVAQMRMNPLQHYLTVGALEGYRPGPLARSNDGERQGDVATARSPQTSRPPRLTPSERGSIDVLRWRTRLEPAKRLEDHDPGEVGIFVHLFYEDLAEDVASLLRGLPFNFRVYASTDTSAKKSAIETSLKRYDIAEKTTVKILPNQGWDIAPFLLGFADEIRAHDICLKLHAKKSTSYANNYGLQWRNYLFSELIGDRHRASFAAGAFLANPELGVLMARHWRGITRRVNVNAIGSNFRPMRALLGRMGISIVRSQPIEFPSGSMFWFRSAALVPLLEAGLHWDDFADCYTSDNDATMAHAVERSILFSAASAGYKWAFLPPRGRWAIRNLNSRWTERRAARAHLRSPAPPAGSAAE